MKTNTKTIDEHLDAVTLNQLSWKPKLVRNIAIRIVEHFLKDRIAYSDAIDLSFVPWRGDFTRGIFISSTLSCDLSLQELNNLFVDFYKDAAFTTVSENSIFLKQVVNTNKAVIQLEKVGSKLVVHSVIDNLLKGASGQAIQNMNLMFGLDEREGLKLKANYFWGERREVEGKRQKQKGEEKNKLKLFLFY